MGGGRALPRDRKNGSTPTVPRAGDTGFLRAEGAMEEVCARRCGGGNLTQLPALG